MVRMRMTMTTMIIIMIIITVTVTTIIIIIKHGTIMKDIKEKELKCCRWLYGMFNQSWKI